MVKRIILIFIFLLFLVSPVMAENNSVVLRAGIAMDEEIPDAFWGTWRIKSKLLETSAKGQFKPDNVDLWNISKKDGVITLDNPFSGARASITLKEVDGNKVVFEKVGNYNNQKLYDVVELTLDKATFTGFNYLKLVTISDIDGRILNTITAKYSLYGDKISGDNVIIEE